ncbi:MAG: adenylate/guanylate cyclase domain-containing protein [Spirochaetales bacterium]|nr:adenylate/guanylate cyclase domain-containing protein [Spirochaetales bacterium]
MTIKVKIILIVLPLLIVALLVSGTASYFLARQGITRIANRFLGFKTEELKKNADYQWGILLENNLTEQDEFVEAAKAGILSFANSLIKSDTERIIAFDEDINLVFYTDILEVAENEKTELRKLIEDRETRLVEPVLGGVTRVATGFFFEPFEWYFMITEEKNSFYNEVNQINNMSLIILGASLFLSVIFLWFFAIYLTKPLTRVVGTMKHIISYNDLSERVLVEYKDEIGELAHTFNIMIGELEKTYNQIKSYALKAVLAQKNEQKIKQIFQKYVPKDVIDQVYAHPESMLVGENRVLSVLFSDIRNFTTISEAMMPDQLVNVLNRYFSMMVDIIYGRKGIVDKYIGDAIMAFFGAPVKHEDDALQSVLTGLDMHDALVAFNKHQHEQNLPFFNIGIGINYGIVTVGNIGCEKKMDYTVIGDMVNLASRLEGLTKEYKQNLIISEDLRDKVVDDVPCRMIDKVRVKGKTKPVNIYSVLRTLKESQKKGWEIHGKAMRTFYERKWKEAKLLFQEETKYLENDYVARSFTKRCNEYIVTPPPPEWDGVYIMKTK